MIHSGNSSRFIRNLFITYPRLLHVTQPSQDQRFASIGSPRKVWAVSAIHGDADRLMHLHDAIAERIRPGDRLVYLGNYTGYNKAAAACVDEILTFRRLLLSVPGMACSDIVYLKGQQEEIWQKLLQLQFAQDPTNVLLWMLGNGLSATLESYGISPHDGIEACRGGVMTLTRWTSSIREAVRRYPGHEVFNLHHARAAHTDRTAAYPMLFVHAGINAHKTLEAQGDHFWWSHDSFNCIHEPYLPFKKVVRGYDPLRGGVNLNCVTATIDGGCGFGGDLVCAGFDENGNIDKFFEC